MIPTTFALFERIEIGGVAPIGAVSGQLGKIAVLLQIRQRPLDGAAGEVHIGSVKSFSQIGLQFLG